MAAEALVWSHDQLNAARIAQAFVGGTLKDHLPDIRRPWMVEPVQSAADMQAAFNML